MWLNLNLLTTTIVAPPNNASKWQIGFNSAFKGLTKSAFVGKKGILEQRLLYLKTYLHLW